MDIYVTRHGETDYNVQKRYAGSTDIPLNDNGIYQARELANKLASTEFDIIITSPLLRAKQTAEIIHNSNGVPMIVIHEFAEINMGIYEGLTRDEARTQYPDIWARLGSRPSDDAPTGGETHRQFDARVANGIAKLKVNHSENRVFLVCHAFVARVINKQIKGLSFEDMHAFTLDNCDIVKYTL